jgi:hypothetical protein
MVISSLSLHPGSGNPSSSRESQFTRDWAFILLGFISPSAMFDMSHIVPHLDELMNIRRVIAFVRTKVLFGVRSLDDNGNQVYSFVDELLDFDLKRRSVDPLESFR